MLIWAAAPLALIAASCGADAQEQRRELRETRLQDSPAGVEPLEVEERDGMVFIPAGPFFMGCSSDDQRCESHEQPRVEVYLDGFRIDKHEVAQGEFARVMGRNPSRFSACGEDCPVDSVTWRDAKAYCEAVGKRLPTEAEWEKAARGGTQTPYYWGSRMDGGYAWHMDNSMADYPGADDGKGSHPVGLKLPNAFGLHDMTGNLWEWVEDCWDADWYAGLEHGVVNPVNLCGEPGADRVLRGGSWRNGRRMLRISVRVGYDPDDGENHRGFRCAMD